MNTGNQKIYNWISCVSCELVYIHIKTYAGDETKPSLNGFNHQQFNITAAHQLDTLSCYSCYCPQLLHCTACHHAEDEGCCTLLSDFWFHHHMLPSRLPTATMDPNHHRLKQSKRESFGGPSAFHTTHFCLNKKVSRFKVWSVRKAAGVSKKPGTW